MSESDQTEIEIDLSQAKFKARGVYEDFRPLVKSGVATVNNVLEVLENAVGVPTDFVNYYLKGFRSRYQEGIEAIPEDRREMPPFRLGCTVIREAVYAADEPNLQIVFANLLITGSDRKTSKNAHPGFASTINQLTWHDAQMLVYLRQHNWTRDLQNILACFDGGRDVTPIVLRNLHRLGMLEWQYRGAGDLSPRSLAHEFKRQFDWNSRDYSMPSDFGQAINLNRGLEAAAEGLATSLAMQLEDMHQPMGVIVTDYGKLFVEACLFGGVPADASTS